MPTKNTSLIDVPVLLMLFNRPETTQAVFDKVREARPSKLFVAANGPRPGNAKDPGLCEAVRAIFKEVDWPCDVHTNFRETNIGMQPHWRLALDWFFESVDSGIILEDDCVPNRSFFYFCGDLLQRYKDDESVMHINGSNFQFGNVRGDASYYFSKYSHVWGWATWRRAWNKYDSALSSFPKFKERNAIESIVSSRDERAYWMRFFGEIYSGMRDGCDVKWSYSIWANDGFCITPNVNMISNIGFGFDAGHTIFKDKTLGQATAEIPSIIHPVIQGSASFASLCDKEADAFTFRTYFYRTFWQKLVYKTTMLMLDLFK
ncbi:MAG: hypothetical protein P4L61_00570 [Candidatus Pacebacteria bacterium]|nr:hypothetical protein [Candidatus Paceibacterota bacterium]